MSKHCLRFDSYLPLSSVPRKTPIYVIILFLKALTEARRVLKPGGALISTYWVDLKMMGAARAVMAAVLGGEDKLTAPPPINPLALAKEGLFEQLVAEAGFSQALHYHLI